MCIEERDRTINQDLDDETDRDDRCHDHGRFATRTISPPALPITTTQGVELVGAETERQGIWRRDRKGLVG